MIVPATNLKDYSKIAQTYKRGEPVFLENNGQTEAVILSVQEYETIFADQLLKQQLAAAADDIKNGRTIPFEEVFEKLYKKNAELLKKTEQ